MDWKKGNSIEEASQALMMSFFKWKRMDSD
jgi:hypothetical protein